MKKKLKKGTVSIIAILTLMTLLVLGIYFLNFTLTESKISQSHEIGTRTYYLAEAGINEAIWKLQNDVVWSENFINESINPDPSGNYWSDEFTRENILGGSYTIYIQNTIIGRGNITVVANFPFGDKSAQRIVKTTVFKGLASLTFDSAVFTGGPSENITIRYTYLRINDGNIFSNNSLDVSGISTLEVNDNPETDELEGKILVANNFLLKDISQAISTATCSKNNCTENCPDYSPGETNCPPDSVSVPLVDFDSESQYSFKSRAEKNENFGNCEVLCKRSGEDPFVCSNECIFSSDDFEDLLWEVGQGGTLILNNEITYIERDLELKAGRHLIINGILVVNRSVSIGERFFWSRQGNSTSGFSQVTVNRPSNTSPSGILAKRKIDFGLYASFGEINIEGIIYSNDQIGISSISDAFNVRGAIIGRKLDFTSLWSGINITLDNDIILYSLGYMIENTPISPTFSPVVNIEHWEEAY